MRSLVRPAAHSDLESAMGYLNRERAGLGLEFLDDFNGVRRFLESVPTAGAVRYGSVRRWSLSTFKRHSVFYTIQDDVVHILRVLHGARSPELWPGVADDDRG